MAVRSLAYSEKTELLYATSGDRVGCFRWDRKRLMLDDQFIDKSKEVVVCLAIGPTDEQNQSQDTLYLSIGQGNQVEIG